MPETPTPSAKPSRFHSAGRNRRWQTITALGAGLIVAAWLFSLFKQFEVNVPVKKSESVLVRSILSRVEIYLIESPWWVHHFNIDSYMSPIERGCSGPGGVAGALFSRPRFERGMGVVRVTIPYWLVLVSFLAIQYAFLPKSRPPPESPGIEG